MMPVKVSTSTALACTRMVNATTAPSGCSIPSTCALAPITAGPCDSSITVLATISTVRPLTRHREGPIS
jgi:hypothetical protein